MSLYLMEKQETVKNKISYDSTYMWNLKYDKNETETDSDIESKLVVAEGRGGMDVGSWN